MTVGVPLCKQDDCNNDLVIKVRGADWEHICAQRSIMVIGSIWTNECVYVVNDRCAGKLHWLKSNNFGSSLLHKNLDPPPQCIVTQNFGSPTTISEFWYLDYLAHWPFELVMMKFAFAHISYRPNFCALLYRRFAAIESLHFINSNQTCKGVTSTVTQSFRQKLNYRQKQFVWWQE